MPACRFRCVMATAKLARAGLAESGLVEQMSQVARARRITDGWVRQLGAHARDEQSWRDMPTSVRARPGYPPLQRSWSLLSWGDPGLNDEARAWALSADD